MMTFFVTFACKCSFLVIIIIIKILPAVQLPVSPTHLLLRQVRVHTWSVALHCITSLSPLRLDHTSGGNLGSAQPMTESKK